MLACVEVVFVATRTGVLVGWTPPRYDLGVARVATARLARQTRMATATGPIAGGSVGRAVGALGIFVRIRNRLPTGFACVARLARLRGDKVAAVLERHAGEFGGAVTVAGDAIGIAARIT